MTDYPPQRNYLLKRRINVKDLNGKWHQPMVFIYPCHPSTHGIYPGYCKWHRPMVFIHPRYLFAHGIVSGIYPWYWPMVSTYGIYTWYCNSKKAINNKPQFVKGQIVYHNVASLVILCFNKTSFFVVLFAMRSLSFFLAL